MVSDGSKEVSQIVCTGGIAIIRKKDYEKQIRTRGPQKYIQVSFNFENAVNAEKSYFIETVDQKGGNFKNNLSFV